MHIKCDNHLMNYSINEIEIFFILNKKKAIISKKGESILVKDINLLSGF